MCSIAYKRYREWLENPHIDENTKNELLLIEDDENEIIDRFYRELEFGTAGIRGIIGAGTNRINKYNIGKTTQGLADYIITKGEDAKNRGVVIAYDPRRMSREFAEEAASVLTGNGIRVYLFRDLRATPILSFAIRFLNCISGIVITASHNPAEYNGYKAYWEDGAQIAQEQADAIIDSIGKVANFEDVKYMDMEKAISKELLIYLDEKVDDIYIGEVKRQSLRGNIVKEVTEDFKIVFTPLHGTGNIPVRRVLREIGFKNVFVVEEQEMPDSEFSTVEYPNPEDKESFHLALELAEKVDADIIIGTDPDCDRAGVVVKGKDGEYVVLTGNQIGVLLVDYILKGRKENGTLPRNGVIIKSIVTGEMGAHIAEKYGIKTISTLTGFKYIGEKIKAFEETGEKVFLFGYEESYGYLAGTHARDKDAVVASMLICEMAAYHFSKGMGLYDALFELYDEYGYFCEDVKAISLEGKDGLEKMSEIMNYFRSEDINILGDKKILIMEDYMSRKRSYLDDSGHEEKTQLPSSNVVKFILDGGGWLCLRPSGTEPKLKIYGGYKGNTYEEAESNLREILEFIEGEINDNF